MPFKIVCSCGVALLAGDDMAAVKLSCPECGGATILPEVPDPYKLPTNAEMIPLEIGNQTRRKIAGKNRRRGGSPRPASIEKETESSTTMNIILIVVLTIIVLAIAVVSLMNS
ncbi:MAG: hypothetical protein COA79_03455 [Planctomycetota bacterium]|nr:MAG: hypothetical protein COA79_03455 [Planctomycetota bacterium]